MDCVYCDAEVTDTTTTYRSKFDDYRLKIKDTPALKCTSCFAIYFDFHIACEIIDITRGFAQAPPKKRPDLISFKKSLSFKYKRFLKKSG